MHDHRNTEFLTIFNFQQRFTLSLFYNLLTQGYYVFFRLTILIPVRRMNDKLLKTFSSLVILEIYTVSIFL